jgi:argininosuccinate lyase
MPTPSQKPWSGRFTKATDSDFDAFGRSIEIDRRLWREDIAVNRAWAKALARVGIYTKKELKQVLAGLDAIQSEFERDTFTSLSGDEDIHMAIERRLTEIAGDAGARIHTGRSRNDQVMTDVRLYLKRVLPELDEEIRSLQRVLVHRAEEHLDTVMPGYTHLQQAQPVLLCHYLLSLFWPLQRDRQRIHQAAERADALPLGSGALAGSAFPVDRHALARELGFSRISENSIDAVSDRDVLIETVQAAALVMLHLSRHAEDLILWSSSEFGFVELSDTFSTGSSMMPQKKNPDSLELIRGKTARVLGHVTTLQALLKGLPLTYARDLQEDKPALFDALDTTAASVRIFTGVLREATFHRERMRQALDDLLLATDLADYLTRKGLPFRQAHRVVGAIVRQAEQSGTPLSHMPLEALRNHSQLFEEDVRQALTVEASLRARNLPGGTGPEAVREQLVRARAELGADP